MQNLGYGFILIVGILVLIMPWTSWNEQKKLSWKTQGLIKLFGERNSRVLYSLIGLVGVILALLGLLGKL